jgi:LmbE family N-acetylglucosaminyl deacetylase
VATLVSFHAHPDDAELTCGGTILRAKAAGHRVVLVIATRGELGEQAPGSVGDGATLAEVRVAETMAAAKLLGVDRVEFLGYRDSGMAGEPSNADPDAFAAASVDDAAARLARILDDEDADILTVYDDHGTYGHPDHIQVHRVGVRAAELAETPRVYEGTISRDYVQRLMRERADEIADLGVDDQPTEEDVLNLGVSEALITTVVDVREHALRKREALAQHASQVPADSWFLSIPEDAFVTSFGYEWFIRRGAPPGTRESDLFDGT